MEKIPHTTPATEHRHRLEEESHKTQNEFNNLKISGDLSAYSEYWFLREGDFLPEKTKNLFGGKGITSPSHVVMLIDAGNIFESKEAALRASMAVRELLLGQQAHLQEGESTNTIAQIRRFHLLSTCRKLQNAAEEILGSMPLLQAQIQESACGHSHLTIVANDQENHQV